MEAESLLRLADKTLEGSIVWKSFAGRSLESVKMLARKVTARAGTVAILGVADACQIVVARSKDMPGDCSAAVKQVAAKLGGRGGGKPELAQAGGFPAASLDSCLMALKEYFSNCS